MSDSFPVGRTVTVETLAAALKVGLPPKRIEDYRPEEFYRDYAAAILAALPVGDDAPPVPTHDGPCAHGVPCADPRDHLVSDTENAYNRGYLAGIEKARRDVQNAETYARLTSVGDDAPSLDVERLARALDAVPGLGVRTETGTCYFHKRHGCRACRPVQAVDASREQAEAIAAEYDRLAPR